MRYAELVINLLLFQIIFLFTEGFCFGEDQKIQHWSFVPPKSHLPPEVSEKETNFQDAYEKVRNTR